MNEVLHHLIIPRGVVGLEPGAPIYVSRDGATVGSTYMGSGGVAIAMVAAGECTLTLGDARNAETVVIEMLGRDCYLHPEGRVSRTTPYWSALIEIREMGHQRRCELEQWRASTTG